MLKTVNEVKDLLRRRYEKVWAEEAAGCGGDVWPLRLPLGSCAKKELEERFVETCERADDLRRLSVSLGLELECATRLVGGSKQLIPSHLVVARVEELASATRNARALADARRRASRLSREFPELGAEETARLLRAMRRAVADDVDFDLACRAGAWFRQNDATGLTARQVPLVGFQAKWLDVAGRRAVVARLAGLDELPLTERPAQVRFTYLDSAYLAGGGRSHDSWVVGDLWELPYDPAAVVICENRDSALWFGQLAGGIAVMGDGFAAVQNLAALDWLREAPLVVYWGDMDAAGLEILAKCRRAGIDCESMLMDLDAYEKYRVFGTNVDKNGRTLGPKNPLDLPELQDGERALYLRLIAPACPGPRRIEQERIPLPDALDALINMCATA